MNHVRSKPMFGCSREKDKRLVMGFAAEILSLFSSIIRFIVSVIFFNVVSKSKQIFDSVDSIKSQEAPRKFRTKFRNIDKIFVLCDMNS